MHKIFRIKKTITAFCVESARLLETFDFPTPESKAQEELLNSQHTKLIKTILVLSKFFHEYHHEHLAAFAKLIDNPIMPLAAATCIRSMLESCALVTWLIDPTIDIVERIKRQFAYRYSGMVEDVKYQNTIGVDQQQIAKTKQRILDVETEALGLGYKQCIKDGKMTGIGMKMLSSTELISKMLDEEANYRFLSAIAHGHNWAIRELTYVPIEFDETGLQMEKIVNIDFMELFSLLGVKAVGKAVWNYWQYMGHDQQELISLFETVFDQLNADINARFWRVS